MNAPCVDGKIRYIADAGSGALGEVPRPVLATWDVESGAYSEVPVVAESIDAPLLRDDGTGTAQVGPASLRDGKLEWFGAENRVMSTDVSTGRTIQKFTVEGHTNNKASSQAVFTDSEVVVLVDNNDGSQYRIVRYDRDTGAERGRVTIAGTADSVSEGLLLRGFAIRP
ncbi:hypothetical protein JT358_02850 [Micrococcales bacterium 31B]|nr:hypothetical protein [Micrococcales bacterium 31B]